MEDGAQAAMLAGYVAGVMDAAEQLEAAGSRARGIAGDVIRTAARHLLAGVAGERAALDEKARAAVRVFGKVA